MRVTTYGLIQASLFVLLAVAQQRPSDVCPLRGPAFPAPRDLSSNEAFRTATTALDAALDGAIVSGSLPYGDDGAYNKTSFSVTLFSGFDEGLLHEYHYTSATTATSEIGTSEIDADSIYRIASVSKLFSAYLLLIRDGEAHLNTPVATIIPELARDNVNSTDGILIDWEQVTVADLMTHMSGLGYNYGFDGTPPDYLQSPAFPQIPSDQMAPCNLINENGTYIGCTREQLIQGVLTTPALSQGGHAPVYSNVGFDLFGLALEIIANAPVQNILTEELINPLNLTGTTFKTPNTTKNGVVWPLDDSSPINATNSEWYQELNYGNADGGYFSSSNDMAAIGRSILSSSLLPRTVTDRWLKPRTFTSSTGTQSAVGAPWEIFKTTDSNGEYSYAIYTKQGDLETYHTMFVLFPDFNFGFTVFSAGEFSLTVQVSSLIVDKVVPAIEEIARSQAERDFAGTYVSSQFNSSITFIADAHPGIKITEWISNSTDVITLLADGSPLDGFDFRLYPNELYGEESGKVGFTGSMEMLPNAYVPGVFSDPCQTWTGPGGNPVGKADVGSFVFELEKGRAMAVESKGLRIRLERDGE